MRVPPPVLVVHPAIAANTAEFGPVGQPPQPTRPRGCNWASGRQEPSLFVILVQLLRALDGEARLAQKHEVNVGIVVAKGHIAYHPLAPPTRQRVCSYARCDGPNARLPLKPNGGEAEICAVIFLLELLRQHSP
jgi:hypothetical protein